ncbi:unnamed protein product [Allacma fusca]|uniref:Multiple inositol polyphosphate phosphatase 1 n=1 Tax=Allacma fusca TaxID=39272 RepID=A0A8J2LIW4_9HEXA|nr:unnamed protein product [Allacma fusca]
MSTIKTETAIATVVVLIGIYFLLWKSTCHSEPSFPVVKYLATKAPYVVHDHLLYNFTKKGRSVEELIPKDCQAEQIWIVARHGTRNPSDKVITKMLEELQEIQKEIIAAHEPGAVVGGQLCEPELSAIKMWQPDLDLEPANEKWLVQQGEVELEGIGARFQKTFPNIFQKDYDSRVYNFKYTKTQRAEASAKHFARGVFGYEEAKKVQYPPALDADPVLRFYKACPKWKHSVDKNPETYAEQRKFESSSIFQTMLERIQTRLGLSRPLTLAEVELLHQTCSFETAWTPDGLSPWCAIFDEDDFEILEYRQDLEYYWVDGYGHELTYKQACAPIGDILDKFNMKVTNPQSPHKVTAYFTHSGTILKFISHLGLFNDTEPLTSDNFLQHKSRKWRTSFIDKFATNIAFVLFRCSKPNSEPSYQIGALFQEHPINIPFCNGNWICPLENFQTYFQSTVNTCTEDVANMCKL